jgi:hypothetical protein
MKTKIEDLKVGMEVVEGDGVKERILQLTANSVLVTRTKRRSEGINCTQWFTIEDFGRYFKI